MVASFAVHVSSDIGCARHEVRVILLHARCFAEQGSKETPRTQRGHRRHQLRCAEHRVIRSVSRRLFMLSASSQS